MKKFFLLSILILSLAACGSEATTDASANTTTEDSTATVDASSDAAAPVAADTVK